MLQPKWNSVAGSIGTYASGATITHTLSAVSTSGSFNLRYYVQSGSLPSGLSLDTYTGVISGTLGVYKIDTTNTFTVRAIDGGGNLRDRTFTITTSKDVAPQFVTASGPLLPALVPIYDTRWIYQQIPYTTSLSDPNVTITVTSGSLPPGLELSTTGLLQGYCSIVPQPTTYTFTLKISNTIGSNTRVYNLLINPTVLNPAPNQRLPTILNSRPLNSTLKTSDQYYGYYRSSSITQFTGSITTTPGIATLEGSVGCTVGSGSGGYTSVGNTLTISKIDGWILPGTEIQSQLTGIVGGIGTYQLGQLSGMLLGIPVYDPATPQTTSSTNIYAINNSSGGHSTFTGSITGTVLTVTSVITGTIGPGQKLYTPGAIFVEDIVTDGIVTATITALPTGADNYASSGLFTLDRTVTFVGPITIRSNKLLINQYNTGSTLIRGDIVIGGTLSLNTYLADQWSGVPGGLGVYVIDSYQQSPYSPLSVDRCILSITSFTNGSMSKNRVVQTSTGLGVITNTIVVDQVTPLLTGESLDGIGRYTVSKAQNVASTPTLILDVDIGTYYYDDYFSYKILGYDFDNRNLTYTYSSSTLPPGLTLNTTTGWITGTPIGVGTTRYNFTVYATNSLSANSDQITFGVVFSSYYGNTIKWVTSENLGTINNYHISNLSVTATIDNNVGTVKYRILNGSLPPALELLDNGLIVGRVSYNPVSYTVQPGSTIPFTFTIEAYTLNYPSIIKAQRTFNVNVYEKYNVPVDTVYLKCTPDLNDRALLLGSSDSLFGTSSKTLTTITRTDSTNNTLICDSSSILQVGSIIQFSGTIIGGLIADTDYYVISVPSKTSFKVSTTSGGSEVQLTTSTGSMTVTSTIIPRELLYREQDSYYGLNTQITCDHIYGVNANYRDAYLAAVNKKHYRRRFTLGELKTAVARDSNNEIIYEVVYCKLIDNLVNPAGTSINYEITWPIPVPLNDIIVWYTSLGNTYTAYDYVDSVYYYTAMIYGSIDKLYPNSLKNMETSLVTELGRQTDTSLMPLWMTSQQADGGTLGYTPAWVICYTKPGASTIVKNNIDQLWPYTLNLINFNVDRVFVDKSMTFNFNPSTQSWTTLPSGFIQPVTIIETVAPNQIICSSLLDQWHIDLAFTISSSTGSAIGGLDVNTVYYVRSIDSTLTPPRMTVSKSLDGATEILVTAGVAGQILTATPLHPGPQPIDSRDYMIIYDNPTILHG